MSAASSGLAGKVVVVTGATGAAGPPVVSALARAGARVVAVGRSAASLEPVVAAGAAAAASAAGCASQPEAGGSVEARPVDLLDADATVSWGRSVVADFSRVDGLLHLVGGWRGGQGIAEADPADWDWLQRNLVVTLIHATKALHDPVRESGGRLAIVSSPQALAPTASNAAYAAAKAAAEAWTLAVADSFAGSAAAAVVVQVKALLTDQMQAERPDRRFPGYTHVDALAEMLTGLWAQPAADLNGTRRTAPAR